MIIAGMLRVKNEARWIKRSIESIAPLCNAGIWVLDDNSTDDTLELAWAAGACVIPSPFVTLNEARDKNMLLQMALHAKPDWIICIDGDEELSGDYRDNLALTMRTTRAYSISLPIWYLWDRPDQLRVDGVYGNFHRESVFRPVPGARFHEAGSGPNFHCGNVPSIPPSLRDRREVVNAPLLHYGYMELITASLSSQASSSAELRKVIEESITNSRDTIIVLEKLALRIGSLPCIVSDPIDGSRTKIEPSRIRHAGG